MILNSSLTEKKKQPSLGSYDPKLGFYQYINIISIVLIYVWSSQAREVGEAQMEINV